MKKIRNGTKAREILVITVLILIIIAWGLREIVFESIGIGNRLIEFTYVCSLFISLFALFYYLLYDECGNRYNWNYYKYYIFLGIMETIALFPFFTQKFMYGDDLWGFDQDFSGSIQSGLFFSRPFISFLQGYVINSNFLHIRSFRLFVSIMLWLFGCILFQVVNKLTGKLKNSFLFALIAIASCVSADCIAYASVYPIVASLLLSTISFATYTQINEITDKKMKRIVIILSAIPLFLAFGMYQIGTPIVFLLYVIAEQSKKEASEKRRFIHAFGYLVYYGCVAITYLGFTKVAQKITGVQAGQSARAQVGSSVYFYLEKISWFIREVIPQTINRIVGILMGNTFFNENNMFYSVTYKSSVIKIVCFIVVIVLIGISVIKNIAKTKSPWLTIIMFSAIFLSFWPFMILPESTYLTYYAIGLILLFTWFFVDGLYTIGKRYFPGKIANSMLYAIILLIILQTNNYAQNVWVNYNRDSYEYVANTIEAALNTGEKINTIVVYGNIGPYVGGREYVIMLVRDVLKELECNSNDITITQYDNINYISIFNDNELETMKNILGEERTQKLLEYYVHDEMYSRWLYSGMEMTQADMDFLRECFLETGQIVQEDKNTILINLTGLNSRNVF